MLENGADGYVIKNAMPEEILLSVESVMENNRFLCEEIDLLMRKRSHNPIWLTPREKELLKHIVTGNTNIEIAKKLTWVLSYQSASQSIANYTSNQHTAMYHKEI